MAEQAGAEASRPTFSSFWKRSKEVLTGRTITFVPSELSAEAPSPGKEAQAHLSEKEKAQLRRAQVRKAQIQHRERKANYVKTLEHDLARYRNLVAQAERETLALKKQNDGLRARIPGGAPAGGSDGGGDEMRKLNVAKTEEDLDADVPMLSDADLEELVQQDMTLTFEFDENMQAPCFQITSSPKPSIDSGLSADMSIATADSEGMTPEQTQEAINFVLALEHICWNHFEVADFQPESAPVGVESGHSLMASSLALRDAPEFVFNTLAEASANRPAPGVDAEGDPIAIDVAVPPHTAVGGPAPPSTTTSGDDDPANPSSSSSPPSALSWNTSSLSLWSLYGLANSLNAPDLDLAPVQAWFELAALYPLSLLLRPDVQARLRREFVGVVKCPHYGAAIERSAYESIVDRVLGPPPLSGAGKDLLEDEGLGASLSSQ